MTEYFGIAVLITRAHEKMEAAETEIIGSEVMMVQYRLECLSVSLAKKKTHRQSYIHICILNS